MNLIVSFQNFKKNQHLQKFIEKKVKFISKVLPQNTIMKWRIQRENSLETHVTAALKNQGTNHFVDETRVDIYKSISSIFKKMKCKVIKDKKKKLKRNGLKNKQL